ncbi:atherin isoform X1 [Iris pallida]|uniref:Atherin isoform X1 n=1 Tax=Iris pallida TaxID=29817 RepID=A0AAX6I9S6_IRIPA|nr:atherin isoform X1 [Iris pallida]
MRHRYLHAKNRARASSSGEEEEEAALSLWPNFLLYRQVFGDVGVGGGEEEEEGESLAKLRRRRMKKKRRTEEKREEEEMAWIERMIAAQVEHERRMVQTHADACRAQLQALEALVRVVRQLVRPASSADDPPQLRRRDKDGKDGPVGNAAGYL